MREKVFRYALHTYKDEPEAYVDIPYSYSDENVSRKQVMKLQVLHSFEEAAFSMHRLKSFVVTTVRGPRSIPASLLQEFRLASDSDISVNQQEASS